MNLPLDIKLIIASFDMDVWIRLSYFDEEFKNFSYNIGRKIFIDLFTIIVNTNGVKFWTLFNIPYRDNDEPAAIKIDGTKMWYKNGKVGRDNDQPACISLDGSMLWFKDGEIHRDNDQPAIIIPDNSTMWYQYSKLHRVMITQL